MIRLALIPSSGRDQRVFKLDMRRDLRYILFSPGLKFGGSVVQPTEDAAVKLAERLLTLRTSGLGKKITQAEFGKAIGRSSGLISSWERPDDPVIPPVKQLEQYAAFFSTPRSITGLPYRVPAEEELNEQERRIRKALREELLALRARAAGPSGTSPLDTLVGRGPWYFPDLDEDEPIVIVCPELPSEVLNAMDHAQPANLDYSDLYRITDLDALFELHGHIRAVNPDVTVEYRSVRAMRQGDPTGHLVVLGGVDWNPLQQQVMSRSDAPVEQVSEDDPLNRGYFRVTDTDESFPPVTDGDALLEDVGYFFRGINPFNKQKTVTVCNGMFKAGVVGTVRALTDKKMRDGNAEYLSQTFTTASSYALLFRVPIIENVDARVVITPEWTAPGTVLYTWSGPTEED
ncbi:transcriptional regulator with XRE-family HTH domain [Actinoplanes tereljensis]|uniref:Uncharacterized protein n=1 Tax=Paractinoplanes tereljensis TaxID=571912 RepID=A0A919TQL6_9ACTN|nr:helix-turn-helix domain-containing protein [Actinoplanes tereljensis]GIF18289.1 hypothetical protein Ate02nite_10190 [Actinoplanes tereljensis]